MDGQDALRPYAVHVMASRTPLVWQPLPPMYPASMQPVPYQTFILPISDQYNLKSQTLTNHMDPLLNEPNQTMEASRWKVQFGQHAIDFCPKGNKDLIHYSPNFSTELDGIHREQEYKAQQSLNMRFRPRILVKWMDREASKGHASTREEQQQQHEVSSAVASRSMTVIVRFPMAKPRMRLPPAPINKQEEELDIRHSNDTNPVIKLLSNTNGEA
jgi:hypothetical protein